MDLWGYELVKGLNSEYRHLNRPEKLNIHMIRDKGFENLYTLSFVALIIKKNVSLGYTSLFIFSFSFVNIEDGIWLVTIKLFFVSYLKVTMNFKKLRY